jgi:hypothetical protein
MKKRQSAQADSDRFTPAWCSGATSARQAATRGERPRWRNMQLPKMSVVR